jgi:capsular exopolysaccharide synthesis family protein
MLTTVYLEKTVEKKLITSNNTIRFIENQLVDITDSLQFSEKQLQEFQSSQKVMNVDFHAQQVFSGLEALQNKKAELLIKLKYYEYLKNYLSTNSSGKDLVAPASMGIDEPMLNNLLAELVKDLGERAEMSLNIKKDNPYIASQDQKIASLRKTLTGNISNIINTTTMSIKETDERINTLSEQAGKLPKTQRQLFGYERKFKLNDALYTYLLTKLNEIQITKAALMPDNEVLDEASYRNSIKVSPKSKNAFLLAIFLGLGFPILLIYLFEYISDKIRDLNEIEKLSGFHSLGFVLRSNLNTNSVVFDFPNSLVAESFRSIRTNLQFVASINKRHTILVTSSTMDEGKSFISLNIAESMALNKKKTILVSFDLRKQLRQTILDLSNEIGLSNYLSGNEKLEDVILKTKNEYFDVILPGPVPPNPTELIASEETTLLFKTLKETYDYIIIDTPPIGMVSDALLLLSHSDVNIYTVRHNTTSRRQLEQLSSSLRKKEVKNFNVIVNDIYIPQKRYGHYGFSYGYNYGYGYGYYHQPEKKLPWAERIINRLFKS